MFANAFTEVFGVEHPIVCGGVTALTQPTPEALAPVHDNVKQQIVKNPERDTVIVSGSSIIPRGLPATPSRKKGVRSRVVQAHLTPTSPTCTSPRPACYNSSPDRRARCTHCCNWRIL